MRSHSATPIKPLSRRDLFQEWLLAREIGADILRKPMAMTEQLGANPWPADLRGEVVVKLKSPTRRSTILQGLKYPTKAIQ